LDGSIITPLEATADGVVVNCSVVPSSNSSSGKTYLTLTFPSFTESLVYDPNLEVHPHDRFPREDQNPLVNNAPVACGATAAVTAALASFMI
jgi:diadenosine tetraphosphatase ApaH/serine/threonine PP2A family protein phosphatase